MYIEKDSKKIDMNLNVTVEDLCNKELTKEERIIYFVKGLECLTKRYNVSISGCGSFGCPCIDDNNSNNMDKRIADDLTWDNEKHCYNFEIKGDIK